MTFTGEVEARRWPALRGDGYPDIDGEQVSKVA
jgi:hypothetical protein